MNVWQFTLEIGKWIYSNLSTIIACLALFISLRIYRRDRWKLSLEAWIEGRSYRTEDGKVLPISPTQIRGELIVKASNVGRRSLTIEKICLQVFEDDIATLKALPKNHQELFRIERDEHIGAVARFAFMHPQDFPVQLNENEPMTADMSLFGIDPLSRSRFCIVYVTGRVKPIKLQRTIHPLRPTRRYFSGS
jgi:hypothetical protein